VIPFLRKAALLSALLGLGTFSGAALPTVHLPVGEGLRESYSGIQAGLPALAPSLPSLAPGLSVLPAASASSLAPSAAVPPAAAAPASSAWLRSDYRAATGAWEKDLLADVSKPEERSAPAARARALADTIRNSLFLFELKRQLAPFKDELSSADPEGPARARLQETIGKMGRSPLRALYSGRLFHAAVRAAENGGAHETQLMAQKKLVERVHRDFAADWERYKAEHGDRHFTETGRDRALMNVVAMNLFAAFDGANPAPAREAITAIASLHPVTDDLIDTGAMRRETVAKISRRLQGIKDPAEHEYENIVFSLIDSIHDRYPRETHPMLHWLLDDLWTAQVRSAAQRAASGGADAANLHTIRKGGLSTSAFGYIALGGLTPRQYEFFFKGGALYQWMDDFSDIEPDAKDGIETLWTGSLSRGEPLRGRFAAMIRIKNGLAARDEVFASFRDGGGIKEFFRRGFYLQYLTASASNAGRVGTAPYEALGDHLSLRARDVEKANGYLLRLMTRVKESDPSGFSAILERFLLNGRTADDVQGQPNRSVRITVRD
jgi:hypothetical protein